MRRTPLGDSFLFGLVVFFLAAGVSTLASILGAAVTVLALGGWRGEVGGILAQPIPLLLGAMVPAQLMILGSAVVAAYWSGAPMAQRLGLVKPRLRWWQGIVVWVGTGVPFAFAVLASRLMPPWDRAAAEDALWGHAPVGLAIAWVLVIGVMPGISEELLFRGVIQRSFLRSMPPPAAILLTTILFGLLHIEPATVALALVLGLWFGIVAWRTGSAIPGMVLHASVNSGWNAAQIAVRTNETAAELAPVVLTVGGIVAVIAFLWAVRILLRIEPPVEAPAERPVGQGGVARIGWPLPPPVPFQPIPLQPIYLPPPPPTGGPDPASDSDPRMDAP